MISGAARHIFRSRACPYGNGGFHLMNWTRENAMIVGVVQTGSTERYLDQAESLCEEALSLPSLMAVVLQQIRRRLFSREQN